MLIMSRYTEAERKLGKKENISARGKDFFGSSKVVCGDTMQTSLESHTLNG